MLKKLTKCGDEDISDLKMYWDTEKKQIRHKFTCDDCGAPTICVCYDKFYEALAGLEAGMLCNKCALVERIKAGDCDLETVLRYITAEQEQTILDEVVKILSDEQCGKVLNDLEIEMDFDCCGGPCNV